MMKLEGDDSNEKTNWDFGIEYTELFNDVIVENLEGSEPQNPQKQLHKSDDERKPQVFADSKRSRHGVELAPKVNDVDKQKQW